MAKNANFVSHKKSKLKENGGPKLPLAADLVEGEIAINFGKDVETLSIKNESGDIVTFSSDNYYTEKKLGSGFTGENSANTVTSVVGSGFTSSSITDVIIENEEIVSAALNDLDERKLDASAYTPSVELWESGTGLNSVVLKGSSGTASGDYSVAEGHQSSGTGQYSHAEGDGTVASGYSSHAEGGATGAKGNYSHAEGNNTTASGYYSHAEGYYTKANAEASHAEGQNTIASGVYSHAEGRWTQADGVYSHAEGRSTQANSESSHAEGEYTAANGYTSHAEGYYTEASGDFSHAEGIHTIAINTSHAEGSYTSANDYSHAEGIHTSAINTSHAEGSGTSANNYSHAEGSGKSANNYSHAEGYYTTARGSSSHAEGYYTKANNQSEHASGQYNVSNSDTTTFGDSGNTLFSVGNGTADNARHNAFEIKQNGDIYITSGNSDIKLQDYIGSVETVTAITPSNSGSTDPIATKVVAENEKIVSNALIDLDERKLDASAYTPTDLSNYYKKSETSGATELSTAFGLKANDADLDTVSGMVTAHTANTVIHVTTEDKSKWNSVDNKLNTSDFNTYSGAVNTVISNKVDKVEGKGLSTNDFTDIEKENVDSLATNIATISGITSTDVNGWNIAATSAHNHTNKGYLDSITGNVGTAAYKSTSNGITNTSNLIESKYIYSGVGITIAYDSTNKVIQLKSASGNVLSSFSANDFIKDGMIDNVTLESKSGTTYLIITWNTDAGKETTELNIGDIFEADNYYTKSQTDTAIESATSGKVDTSTFNTHTASSVHMSATEKTNLDSLATNIATISGITSTKVSNWDNAASNSHSHANKSVIDTISQGDIDNWNSKTSASGTVTSVQIGLPTGLSASTTAITTSGKFDINYSNGYAIPTTAKQGQWDTAYANNHTHSNKTALDSITGSVGTMAYQNANSYSSATDVNTALSGKSNTGHTHDDRYYTESELTDLSTTVVVAKAASATTAASAGSVAWGNVTGKPETYTPSAHNQASNTITAMTGYAKASTAAAIASGDTLNAAIGKLEKALDGKQPSGSYVTTGRKVSTASGLTGGGDLSADRTIGLATVGTAGTYYRVVVDEYGRVTSGNTTDTDTNYYTTGLTVSTAETSNTITVKGNNSAVAGTAVLNSATTSAAGLMSKADKSKLDGVSAGAEVNQNAWSKIKINAESTTIDADTSTDTLTVSAGTFVTLTSDATNDKFTIGVSTGTSSSTLARGDHNHDSTYQAKGSYLSATTKYAGSSETGGAATSANKLNTNAGNTTTPVYFSGGVPTALSYTIAKSVPSDAKFTDTTYTFDGTYNASTNKAATVSTVTNAIGALDANLTGSAGAGKTLTAFSQTDGKVTATFGDISITKSQVSDFPTSMTPTAHNQASNTITAMTGYAIASASGAVATNDTLNNAVGKLEKRIALLEAALGGMTLVKLTSAQYEALTTKDPNTVYVIND